MTSVDYDKLWEEAHRPLPSYQDVISSAYLEALTWWEKNKHLFKTGGDHHDNDVSNV